MTLVVNHSTNMDIQSFNKKLSKISVIVDSLDSGANLSSLERDLLLSYIRDLYDLAIDGQPLPKAKPAPVHIEKVVEPVVVAQPKAVTSSPTPEPVIAPIVEVAPPVVEKVVEITPPAPVTPAPVFENVETPAPVVANISNQVESINLASVHEDIRELFAEEKANDFSEKLSLTPIKDLTKSMGINERVLMLQELFGNNKDHFAESLEKLNNMSGFSDASAYIVNVLVPKYDWTTDKRAKHATTFIKLVRRRYI